MILIGFIIQFNPEKWSSRENRITGLADARDVRLRPFEELSTRSFKYEMTTCVLMCSYWPFQPRIMGINYLEGQIFHL